MEAQDWQRLAQPGFSVDLTYPSVTPQGHTVERTEERANDHRGDLERVHLSSPESGELYVEVARFRGQTPQGDYDSHRAHLEQRFGAGAVTALSGATVQGRPAFAYDFRWADGERSVLMLEVAGDTYRVIYDPTSKLNHDVVATLTIAE